MCYEYVFGVVEDDLFFCDVGDFVVEGLGLGEGDVWLGEWCSE